MYLILLINSYKDAFFSPGETTLYTRQYRFWTKSSEEQTTIFRLGSVILVAPCDSRQMKRQRN